MHVVSWLADGELKEETGDKSCVKNKRSEVDLVNETKESLNLFRVAA